MYFICSLLNVRVMNFPFLCSFRSSRSLTCHDRAFCFRHSIQFWQPIGTYFTRSSVIGGMMPLFFLFAGKQAGQSNVLPARIHLGCLVLYPDIATCYCGSAKEQHGENGLGKPQRIKGRPVIRTVHFYFLVGMNDVFVFHIGMYFRIVEKL